MICPWVVPHQGDITGWICKLEENTEWILGGPPIDVKTIVYIKIPFSQEFLVPLSSYALAFLLALELGDVQALNLAGDVRELRDVEGSRVLP